MVVVDLAEVQGYINSSFRQLTTDDAKVLGDNHEKKEEMGLLQLTDEPWIFPVASQSPTITSEPLAKRSRPSHNPSELSSLDVIRAFCHPSVIDVVARVLRGNDV